MKTRTIRVVSDVASCWSSISGSKFDNTDWADDDGDYYDDDNEFKLHGRMTEHELLQNAYARIQEGSNTTSELIVVHGPSGVGKTALVESMRNPVMLDCGGTTTSTTATSTTTTTNGYFCRAKFEKEQSADPFAAITAALSDLCDLIEQDNHGDASQTAVKSFRRYLQDEYVLTYHAAARFGLICRDFIREATARPLVLFLDNLQWAEKEALAVVQALLTSDTTMNSSSTTTGTATTTTTIQSSVLYIATVRKDDDGFNDNDDNDEDTEDDDNDNDENNDDIHELLTSSTLPTTYLKVENLGLDAVHQILLDALQMKNGADNSSNNDHATHAFAELLLSRTGGNPYFVLQFLDHLQDEGILARSSTTSATTFAWDLSVIQRGTRATDNIAALLEARLQKMSPDCKSVLIRAAFLGIRFERQLLHVVVQQDNDNKIVHQCLRWAIGQGLFEDGPSSTIQFTHDRIQQCLFHSIVEPKDRMEMHYRIGSLLKKRKQQQSANTDSFLLSRALLLSTVEHLNIASDTVLLTTTGSSTDNDDDDDERLDLVHLNLDAATVSISNGAFRAAVRYLSKGLSLIDAPWENNHYTLTLQMSNLYAKCLYSSGQFHDSVEKAEDILINARCITDKTTGFQVIVDSLAGTGAITEAFDRGISFLSQMDEDFPSKTTTAHVAVQVIRAHRKLRKFSNADLLAMPVCVNDFVCAKHYMMTSVAYICIYTNREELMGLLTLRILRQCLKLGYTPCAPMAFAGYAMILLSIGRRTEATRFGNLALGVLDMYDCREVRPRVIALVHFFVLHWQQESMHDSLRPIVDSVQNGLDLGDVKFSFLSAALYLFAQINTGVPLPYVAAEAKKLAEWSRHYNDPTETLMIRIGWQFALNMMDEADDPKVLTGEATSEETLKKEALRTDNTVLQNKVHVFKAKLEFYLGSFGDSLAEIGEVKKDMTLDCSHHTYIINMISALCHFSLARYSAKHGRRARRSIRLFERLGKEKNPNTYPIYLLLLAEDMALRGQGDIARAYRDAIDTSSSRGFLHIEALANERAAGHFFQHGENDLARKYIRRAIDIYEVWAPIKMEILLRRHATLLLHS